MELHKPATPLAFRDEAGPLLLRHEIEHGLIYSVAGAPDPPPDAYCAIVTHDGEVVAAVIRTIKKAALSREEMPGAIALIAADALKDPRLEGVVGPRASIEAFAAASGRRWREGMAQGIYECRRVIPPPRPAGLRRLAMPDDKPLLAVWIQGFLREAGSENPTLEETAVIAERHIASRGTHLWEVNGEPVSYAGAYNRTPHGVRVGPVYTPPQHRGRGYAAALVARITQRELDGGCAFAYLYTNLANPTSNALYQRIGYRRVGEAADAWIVADA